MEYYVQDIAANYRKNLHEEPGEYKVHASNLYGVDEAEMKSGYGALLELFAQLYADIEGDPAAFSMLLRESLVPDAKNSDYTLSNQSLIRVPNLLFVFGVYGELEAAGSLSIRGDLFHEAIKNLKITKAPALMAQLAAYGLLFEGASKTPGQEGPITLACPDNQFLPAALKATSTAMLAINKGNPKRGKDLFYSLHSGLLTCAPGKAPTLTLEDMCRTISPERGEIARHLDQTVAPYAKRKVTLSGIMRNDWGCVYTLAATGRVLLTLNVNQDVLHVKMNLARLGAYTGLLDECAPPLRASMLSTWDCGGCNPSCAGGFQFTYQGKAYNKCRGGAFQVPGITADQVEDCIRFLYQEATVGA